MLQTHRAGKGPGDGGGWGLGSTEGGQASALRGQRIQTGSLEGFLGLRAGQMPSEPLLLLLEGPSYLPLLFSPGLPPTPPRPMQPGGGLWGHRTESRAGFLGWLGRGNAPPRSEPPRVSPGMGTPPPSQPPLRGAGPVWPPLLLPPQSPHVLLVRLGVPPVCLGIEVPHQRLAVTLVVGRHELLSSQLPSWLCLSHFKYIILLWCLQNIHWKKNS